MMSEQQPEQQQQQELEQEHKTEQEVYPSEPCEHETQVEEKEPVKEEKEEEGPELPAAKEETSHPSPPPPQPEVPVPTPAESVDETKPKEEEEEKEKEKEKEEMKKDEPETIPAIPVTSATITKSSDSPKPEAKDSLRPVTSVPSLSAQTQPPPPSPVKRRFSVVSNEEKKKPDYVIFNAKSGVDDSINVGFDVCAPVKCKTSVASKFQTKVTLPERERLIAYGSDCLCYKRKSVLKVVKGGNDVNYKVGQISYFDVCPVGLYCDASGSDVICCTFDSTNTVTFLPVKPGFDAQSL